ncbi:hypothetical protein EES39_31845 [Streptomyces sp. ADI92-24]|uniref:hypothetical protein n=1 Tax=Streptomyces sp. ADI92-24 TaxID=1522756 RepID=UPI000F555C21|nr:hypothetical protein [Streptomyces sp. ADI92-24]RPK36742.1 hypothetical protein EES39_31845 [Streptomyces sp. ADI92-24]
MRTSTSAPATFKPCGGIVTPAFIAAPVEDRTTTYQLKDGGVLVEECPSWCQWPHTTDRDGSEVPYMAYRANANYGEAMGYSTPTDVEAEIRRTETHLHALRQMNERLAAARADHLEQRGLDAADLTVHVKMLPVPVLLKAFGPTAVEVESIPLRHSGGPGPHGGDAPGPRHRAAAVPAAVGSGECRAEAARADRRGPDMSQDRPIVAPQPRKNANGTTTVTTLDSGDIRLKSRRTTERWSSARPGGAVSPRRSTQANGPTPHRTRFKTPSHVAR